MSSPTPSKLAILRAAGQVQREIAADQNAAGQQVLADVHHPTGNVTTRRRQDPLEQITVAQDELSQVQSDLQAEEQLLQRLRGAHLTDGETEFEDAQDGEDVDDDVDPGPRDSAGRSTRFDLPETLLFLRNGLLGWSAPPSLRPLRRLLPRLPFRSIQQSSRSRIGNFLISGSGNQ